MMSRKGCSSFRWRRGLGALLLACGLLAAPAAQAWNAAGHRLSAMIAWEALDPDTRAQVAGLLRLHPDHPRWIAHARGADPDLTAFVEASTWPDDIRDDPRFHEADEDPTPTLPGFPDMERHRQWHYLNRPLHGALSAQKDDGELERQLSRLTRNLRSADAQRRAWALPWLIHLVGDAHQPLHVATRIGPDGKPDAGGNGLIVDNPFLPKKRLVSLHRYWDDRPGPPWLRGEALGIAARAIVAANPPPPPSGTFARWIDESFAIAGSEAYPPDAEEGLPPVISAEFDERAGKIADRRIAWSGYRLAELLQRTLH
ncbi:S1/P1 nuclease [Rhodocyclus purpureus]|uniref:S1/P1 nuclease n=1 Tax=Rhodocyclus purpureus TaxID=1067 RepID=UPI001914AFD3|nr:S1/P1 nuclease [Rhodocyclus purpureus]MBK5913941.1 hypothetical protein [Rhodocyclus purpureus]